MERRELAQQKDIFAVIAAILRLGGIDDQRPVMADLLLQPRVAVPPVGARLPHRNFVSEGLARPDPREAHARHPVELKRDQQPVPMHGSVLFERVRDMEPDRSEEHTSELQSLMPISYAVFCLKKTKTRRQKT